MERFDDYAQVGGGNCKLCGAKNTNKTTCPDNPKAKRPNWKKHPLAKRRAAGVAPISKPTPVVATKKKAPTISGDKTERSEFDDIQYRRGVREYVSALQDCMSTRGDELVRATIRRHQLARNLHSLLPRIP